MSTPASTFFVELSSLFDPKGFDQADSRVKESSSAFGNYFSALTAKNNAWGDSFAAVSRRSSAGAATEFKGFFDITSKNFLDLESLAKGSINSILNSFLSSFGRLAGQSLMGGVFGLGGAVMGGLSGLLGSRRSGGPIGQTGPYLLHEGEFVLPPEVVTAIKQNHAPQSLAGGGAGGGVNISVSAPINITAPAAAAGADAKALCDEIAQAARRGVSWAVEAAKINYKIGRRQSGEASI